MNYRFYRIVGSRIFGAEDHTCSNDHGASAKAADILVASDPRRCDSIEFWQGTRLVAAVSRDLLKAAG